jgi:enamine deaminase RidA (YjgF/YER057c/UK114 family)
VSRPLPALLLAAFLLCASDARVGNKRKWNPEKLFQTEDFSHVVESRSIRTIAFISAQSAADPEGRLNTADNLTAQTRKTLRNLAEALSATGAVPDDVVSMHIYVTDYQQAKGMIVGRQVRKMFENRVPASSFIPVSQLPIEGAQIQIDAVVEMDH